MAIVKGNTKKIDVIEIESEGVRSTYALSGLCWGLFQEAKTKIDAKKHWWAGPWKKQMAFISRTVRNWPHPYFMSLNAEDSLKDSKDALSSDLESGREQGSKKGGNLENAQNSEQNTAAGTVVNRYQEIQGDNAKINESGKTQVDDGSSSETSAVHITFDTTKESSKLQVQVWKAELSRSEFILDGWKWLDTGYGTVKTNNEVSLLNDEIKLSPQMDELTWYSIDGEEFEAKPVNLKILREKLTIFC